MNETLESKIRKIESKMPGFLEHTEGPAHAQLTGVKYMESKDYKVAVCKWQQHSYDISMGGVEWTDYLTVCYQTGNKKIRELKPESIVTRDKYNPQRDKQWLWGYDNAGGSWITPTRLEVYWTGQHKRKGPSYIVDLTKNRWKVIR